MPCACCTDGIDKAEISTDAVFSTMDLISSQIKETAFEISKESVDLMLTLLMLCKDNGNCIFVAGAGRSGFIGRAFAMRLMQLGLKVHMIGETVTPAVQEGDLLIAISGSGSTKSIVNIAEKCQDVGAFIVSLTSEENSALGELSSVNVVLPSKSNIDNNEDQSAEIKTDGDLFDDDSVDTSCRRSVLMLMGTAFEILTLIFTDAVVLSLTYVVGASEDDMKARHANTE
jgi:Predicted sugar phosphate isomerase involved in capsule formation